MCLDDLYMCQLDHLRALCASLLLYGVCLMWDDANHDIQCEYRNVIQAYDRWNGNVIYRQWNKLYTVHVTCIAFICIGSLKGVVTIFLSNSNYIEYTEQTKCQPYAEPTKCRTYTTPTVCRTYTELARPTWILRNKVHTVHTSIVHVIEIDSERNVLLVWFYCSYQYRVIYIYIHWVATHKNRTIFPGC